MILWEEGTIYVEVFDQVSTYRNHVDHNRRAPLIEMRAHLIDSRRGKLLQLVHTLD